MSPHQQTQTTEPLTLSSPAFSEGDEIPRRYTRLGENLSPPLGFSPAPEGTKSLVLIVDDPDAPDPVAPKMRWVHWVLYNLPPDTRELREGASPQGLPPGTLEGLNDWKAQGWDGPEPPIGQHRYFFVLYALDTVLPKREGLTRDQVLKAITGHVLAESTLVGTYQKGSPH